jgi:DNA repair protein RadC
MQFSILPHQLCFATIIPQGNLKPSTSDISITKKMDEAARLMDIKVLDHIILADRNYFSFADEGLL